MLQIGQIGQIHRQIHRTSGLSKIIKGSAERLPKRTESCAHKHGTRRISGDSRHTCAHSPAQSGNMTWKVSARAASEGSLPQLQLHRRVFAKRTASFDGVQGSLKHRYRTQRMNGVLNFTTWKFSMEDYGKKRGSRTANPLGGSFAGSW